MKKIIVIVLAVSIIAGIGFCGRVFFASAQQNDAGAYLKSLGIVYGYKNGALYENKYITQAEYLSLLARLLRKTKKVHRENLVKQVNYFDYLINKAYHAYLILYNKILTVYYEKFSKFVLILRHKYTEGSSNAWYFSDLMYLKRNGFNVPQNFRPDAVISTGSAIKWLLGVFGLGESKEFIVKDGGITSDDVVQILSVEHNFNFMTVSDLAKPVKRGEAFSLIAYFLRENNIRVQDNSESSDKRK